MTAEAPPAPAGPWRVLRRALIWVLVAELAALAASFLIVFVIVLAHTIAHPHVKAHVPQPLVYALPATLALQATLLFADLRQGRIFGHGHLAAGLGAGPVQRQGLVAALLLAMIAWVLAYILFLVRFQEVASFIAREAPPTPVLTMTGGPALIVVRLILIGFLAPVAEELFFRGWFWTALRRSWSVWPTALCTGGIWVALHALEGMVRVPILIPAAILLSLARHYGGSVRASIPLHIANNVTAVAVQLVALSAAA